MNSLRPDYEAATPEPISTGEATSVLLICTIGLALRAWRMSGVTLDHFDEAVYAFSALGVSDPLQPHRLYPRQEIFSPPFYFGLGGLLSRLFGIAPDHALLALSICFGALTVAAVWWIARAGFGVRAGLAAACIVALNPFHIAFSRSALTDVTFTFFLLCALGALVAAVEQKSLLWGLLAGILTGIAWNTKYHGWFALLISGAALVPYCWSMRGTRERWQSALLPWLVASATAFLCYVPWLLFLRTRGSGYNGMLRHYLGMLRSGAWWYNVERYAAMLAYFEAPIGRVAMALALVIVLVFTNRRRMVTGRLAMLLIGVALSALVLGSAGSMLLMTLAATPLLLRKPVPFRTWVLLGTIALWLVAAPVYRPYARLLLPFTIATAIGAGFALTQAVEWMRKESAVSAPRASLAWVSLFVVVTCALSFYEPGSAQPWQRDRGMRSVADSMARLMPRGTRVFAVIEPPPAYYLQRAGRALFERARDFEVLDTLSTPAYVITGGYVRRSRKLSRELAALQSHLVPLKTYRYRPYDVRLLDDMAPAAARRYRARPDSTFDLHLFRYSR